MAIQLPDPRRRAAIPCITYVLKDRLASEDEPASKSATYQLEVVDQNGARIRWQHDQGGLLPHISDEDRDWLLDFATRFRATAELRVIENE